MTFAITMVALFAFTPSAFAGRLFVTGHDADAHCSSADLPQGQCHFVTAAINYVRATAPNPARPLLLLDCTATRDLQAAINSALGPQSATTICPSKTLGFKNEPLTTDRYSAIVVGSSADAVNINTLTTTPDSVAINARAADIASFFNQGGGVIAFAGDKNADGVESPEPETYYRFLPIPLGGKAVEAPFTLTPAGVALGLQDSRNGIGTLDDINCCPTHNSFDEPPVGGALQVAERDAFGSPETLYAEGTIGSKTIVPGPSTGQVVSAPSAKQCVRRKRLKIRINQPAGATVKKASIYVNGKRVRTLKRKAFGSKPSLSVTLKKLPGGTARVRIVVRTTKGVVYEKTRSYKSCASKNKSKKKKSSKKRKSRK